MRWLPPPNNFIKLNFDGSFINTSAAGGFIIREWTGKLIQAGAAHFGETSIIVAKARELKNGVIAAIQADYRNIIIEGDYDIVIQALKGTFHTPWQIAMIIEDVRLWLEKTNCTVINHIFQKVNQVAD